MTQHTTLKVLIGITTHNRADILAKSIQSALDQDYPNKEVAVFDDASTDETPSFQERFPTVRWYREDSNKGYLHARNRMMRETDADVYFSLDDDAWFLEGNEVSIGVDIMRARREVAALAYDILSPDRPEPQTQMKPQKTHVFIGCGHMLRLQAVNEVGYYIPNPGSYGGEEQDLCIRLLDHNHEIEFLPGVHVWHDKSLSARNISAQHVSGVCNDLVFAFRRTPSSILLWLLPAKILSHLRFAIGHNFVKPCLSGIGLFFGSLPALLSTREPVSHSTFQEYRQRLHSNT
jgi:GT2 family glycosyltransferase